MTTLHAGVAPQAAASAALVAEPQGPFMAFVLAVLPGLRRHQTWPSAVACPARLIIHHHAMLGVLDEEGRPLQNMGVPALPSVAAARAQVIAAQVMTGKPCPNGGPSTLIHKDGCDFCTSCG